MEIAVKYDDASWHYGGEFPDDLPDEAGATHISMYLCWAVLSGLGSEMHADGSEEVVKLKSRSLTPREYFLRVCDGKMTDEDFNADGNDFAQAYFALEDEGYADDYADVFDEVEGIYYVQDTWDNYDFLCPLLDRTLAAWRATQSLCQIEGPNSHPEPDRKP